MALSGCQDFYHDYLTVETGLVSFYHQALVIGDEELIETESITLSDDILLNLSLEKVEETDTVNLTDDITLNLTLEKVEETESIALSDDIFVTTSENIELSDTTSLSDSIVTNISTRYSYLEDSITISDSIFLNVSQEKQEMSESVSITDSITVALAGSVDILFNTELRTKLRVVPNYNTTLTTCLRTIDTYNTELRLKVGLDKVYGTDLRVKYVNYDLVEPKSLDSIIVKLDGSELTDADINSLRITFNLNSTPSVASFTLGRHHDDLDHDLNEDNSEITNENKITIYDGTILLFTGYITQINAQSDSDTVGIIAEDARYKMSKDISYELEYGGKIDVSDDGDTSTTFSKTVGTAITEILDYSVTQGIIIGFDSVDFSNSFIPEYVETYNTCANLLDELVKNGSMVNWYLDENEYVRFQKVTQGQIKKLDLSSIDSHRHIYDVLVNNISLNKKQLGYARSLKIKFGKQFIRKYHRKSYSGWIDIPKTDFDLPESTTFCFQDYFSINYYVGVGKTIYGAYSNGWILKPTMVVQYLIQDEENEIGEVTIGSGEPVNTLYLTNYGKKETNLKWEEKEKDGNYWLVHTQEEAYDYQNFAEDLANFELNQRNTLLTTANVALLLDSFEYYEIGFKNRINLGNTIAEDIYNNNNGFPLNIQSYTLDASNRVITLNLTNFGQQWYERSTNILLGYSPSKNLLWYQQRSNVIKFVF